MAGELNGSRAHLNGDARSGVPSSADEIPSFVGMSAGPPSESSAAEPEKDSSLIADDHVTYWKVWPATSRAAGKQTKHKKKTKNPPPKKKKKKKKKTIFFFLCF